jgi:hypothetical protein
MPTQCEASSTPNGTDCTVTYHTNGCDDGDACTTADACSGGACVGGAPPTCDDQNPCTDDSCVSPGGCVAPVSAAGASCPGGVCDGSTCVACLSGQVEHCNPQCGAFDTGTDGYRICTDNSWGTCQPVACEPGTPTYYQAVPVDHDWHCNLWMWPGAFTMYLCLKATNTFACGSPAIEFQLQKSDDVGGTVNFGAFDNDVSLVLRNVNSGLTRDVSQVNCAGQQTCTFTVGVSELINSLGLSGTDGFQADIKSPPGVTSVGTTGTANLVTCY